MKAISNGFRPITYSGSVTRYHTDILTKNPELQRLGWRLGQVWDLSDKLHRLLLNYEINFETGRKIDLIFSLKTPPPGNIFTILDDKKSRLTVYLNADPEQVCARAPGQASIQLIDTHFKSGNSNQFGSNIFAPLLDKSENMIRQGFSRITEYYLKERQIDIKSEKLSEILGNRSIDIGFEVIKRKLSYILLNATAQPGLELAGESSKYISGIREKARKIVIDDPESERDSIWEVIANLAMYATLAYKTGHRDIYHECLDVLRGGIGYHFALCELGLLFHDKLDFPIEAQQQLNAAINGYLEIFKIFENIFEYYYDTVIIP